MQLSGVMYFYGVVFLYLTHTLIFCRSRNDFILCSGVFDYYAIFAM
jgi:hypothetical protein